MLTILSISGPDDEPAPRFRTISELRLARLTSLRRPLTDEESDDLRRARHAVYCYERAQRVQEEADRPARRKVQQEELTLLHLMLGDAARGG